MTYLEVRNYLFKNYSEVNKTRKGMLIKDENFIGGVLPFLILHTSFLSLDANVKERIYCILNELHEKPKCIICGKELIFYKPNACYKRYCSARCSANDRNVRDKYVKTCLEKYGVTNVSSLQDIQKKKEETLLKNYNVTNMMKSKQIRDKMQNTIYNLYGVDNVSKSDLIKNKKIQTSLTKYGKPHIPQVEEFKQKYQNTCLERYGNKMFLQSDEYRKRLVRDTGYEYLSQIPEIKEKKKNTCRSKYGVDSPLQSPYIFQKHEKSLIKYKKYIFPSGRIEYVQGYEPMVLDELIKYFDEDDIIVKINQIPVFWYENLENKKSRYYPDIFIKSRNMVIEVKSTYILSLNGWGLSSKSNNIVSEINLRKRQSVIDAGYNFWFAVYK